MADGKFKVGDQVKVVGSKVTGEVTKGKDQRGVMVYEVKRAGGLGTYLESQLEPIDARPVGVRP